MIRSAAGLVLTGVLLCPALVARPAGAQQMPWLKAEVRATTDNQPRDAFMLWLEHGRYLSPDITLAGHAAGHRIGADATAELGATGTLSLPAARLGLSLTGGTLFGGSAAGMPLLADARVGLGVGADVTLRARVAQARYTATLASIDTMVLSQTVEVAVDRASSPGWAGELLARRESYGDNNPVTTAYAWALAPLSRGAGHSLRAGYGLGWQDAAESRWVRDPERRGPPRGPNATSPDTIAGRYSPYYTPHDVLTHSVLANAAAELNGSWLVLDAAYGVRATELAPTLQANAVGAMELVFVKRSFSPYRAAATWTKGLDNATSLSLNVEHSRTAYFRQTSIRAILARSLGGP